MYNDVFTAFFKLRFLTLAFVLSIKSPKIKECEKELSEIFGIELLASLKNLNLLSAIPCTLTLLLCSLQTSCIPP